MTPKGPGEREWDAVAEVVRELSETIREPDRRERMRRLFQAAASQYADAGEPEPEWIKTARRLFFVAGSEGTQPEQESNDTRE